MIDCHGQAMTGGEFHKVSSDLAECCLDERLARGVKHFAALAHNCFHEEVVFRSTLAECYELRWLDIVLKRFACACIRSTTSFLVLAEPGIEPALKTLREYVRCPGIGPRVRIGAEDTIGKHANEILGEGKALLLPAHCGHDAGERLGHVQGAAQ